jgi:hypothetical protein
VSLDQSEIVTESDLEYNAAGWLEARRDVRRLRDQWPAVSYRSVDGAWHTHTFDFHCELDNGLGEAVAVRPSGKVGPLRETLRLIMEQRRLDGIAVRAVLLTEKVVTDAAARNARNVLRARKLRDDAECRAALKDIDGIHGSVRFYDLVRNATEPALRRNALWCLIYEQVLVPVNPRERITDATILRVSRAIH